MIISDNGILFLEGEIIGIGISTFVNYLFGVFLKRFL